MSKSMIKRIEIQREGQVPTHKNPKIPVLPVAAQATYDVLTRIIDAGGEKATTAYAALSRLCVLWTPGALANDDAGLGGGQMGEVVNDLLGLMFQLFPDGDGLPYDDEPPA